MIKSVVEKGYFNGYGCELELFNWIFTSENSIIPVIAHNGSGYDYKLIVRNAIESGKYPHTLDKDQA